MGNLLEHHLHFQRINIFIFACNEHRSHTNDVQVTNLTGLTLALEVPIYEGDCQEESLVVALEVC